MHLIHPFCKSSLNLIKHDKQEKSMSTTYLLHTILLETSATITFSPYESCKYSQDKKYHDFLAGWKSSSSRNFNNIFSTNKLQAIPEPTTLLCAGCMSRSFYFFKWESFYGFSGNHSDSGMTMVVAVGVVITAAAAGFRFSRSFDWCISGSFISTSVVFSMAVSMAAVLHWY